MGVDYYQCANCNRGFRDDSEYCAYCECGNCFCSKECGKLENYGDWSEEDDTHRIDLEADITCVICRHEAYTDYTLLESLLKHFNITREQAVNIWRAEKHHGK
jgi:putative heme degradation protein